MKKSGEKVDKGFEFLYVKLSWRRKFIRTLWMLPISILCLLGLWAQAARFESVYLALIITPLITGVWIWQAVHTYRKWKAGEQEQN